jgi:uncharacterized protein
MRRPLLLLALVACMPFFQHCTSTMEQKHRFTNALIHESSPYLLQHAHNPVNWYPWGEEALKKAKDENKLLIISVGYAACHWCHVMEHESFEDSLVAATMNAHFVSIKVDREERPDIDQIYMDAVQLMTGSGGWPLNCVALPDGRPIWGGTYFQKTQWISILGQLSDLWNNNPGEARRYADQLVDAVTGMDTIVKVSDSRPFHDSDIEAILQPWRGTFDLVDGGPNRAPKFPLPNNWLFLMRAQHYTQDAVLDEAIDLTLRKMAWGGIYDQLGGGFARYSVDRYWKVPHFEKMTYDNGQLVSLYCEAYRRKPEPLYKRIVDETLAYTTREMTSPEGGFYSSLDADSEGEEGRFYVWTKRALDSLLGAEATWFCEYYQVTSAGNWEHGNNVLITQMNPEAFAAQKGWTAADFTVKLENAKRILFAERAKRIRPGLDDKVLTSWNALMLKGYVDAYRVFDEPAYLAVALRNASFIESKLRNGDQLYRNYKAGKASINAFLDDYALLAEAYISLYEATLDPQWLHRARGLVDYARAHFLDDTRGMFFYTSDLDPKLITRKTELLDNVIPGSNSVMANVLFQLGHYFDHAEYSALALQMLQNVRKDMPRYGSGYSNWAILLLRHAAPYYEVVAAGPQAKTFVRTLDRHYLPHVLLAGAAHTTPGQLPLLEDRFVGDDTRIYVCENKVCQLPVNTVAAALPQLKVRR